MQRGLAVTAIQVLAQHDVISRMADAAYNPVKADPYKAVGLMREIHSNPSAVNILPNTVNRS